ncbi:hypothetical protein PGT21_001664 [Puccinia graminis f. sp. tritici]|uniref:Secreted protein n=1 Tax=Puccinia graminis f. sp. tritici TaxID=56615 RepID=A0A5B0NT31_PUCGR|nr:hypothetical protein PGT21_001531 [Puccinia graminis f. sp. tritici]KAA1092405.1 hypothetical protein PGT21_001664 [Puccinia graminis f. sp. tritici]
MLIKKALCYLATPSLLWAQAINHHVQPGVNPAEQMFCLHIERVPVEILSLCAIQYTCNSGHVHSCGRARRRELQQCTNCPDETGERFLDPCEHGPCPNIQ